MLGREFHVAKKHARDDHPSLDELLRLFFSSHPRLDIMLCMREDTHQESTYAGLTTLHTSVKFPTVEHGDPHVPCLSLTCFFPVDNNQPRVLRVRSRRVPEFVPNLT